MGEELAPWMFPGEWIETGAGYPALCRHFPGDSASPLVVFIPGGGLMGRIAYGHPDAHPDDFLAAWLQRAGMGVLVHSFPSDHPVFPRLYPHMTIDDWGRSVAAITASVMAREQLRAEVVLVGWSMGGRMSAAFNRHAQALNLKTIGFISLSANAPLPGLAPLPATAEALTPGLLWNVLGSAPSGTSFASIWEAELAPLTGLSGEPLFSREICRAHYFVNSPINLRGEATRLVDGQVVSAVDEALADMGTLDFGGHPLTASIVPTHASDAKHALTDQATYAFFNTRMLYQKLTVNGFEQLSPERWEELRGLFQRLSEILTRFQPGGHFFFVGAPVLSTGASQADLVTFLCLTTSKYAFLGIHKRVD